MLPLYLTVLLAAIASAESDKHDKKELLVCSPTEPPKGSSYKKIVVPRRELEYEDHEEYPEEEKEIRYIPRRGSRKGKGKRIVYVYGTPPPTQYYDQGPPNYDQGPPPYDQGPPLYEPIPPQYEPLPSAPAHGNYRPIKNSRPEYPPVPEYLSEIVEDHKDPPQHHNHHDEPEYLADMVFDQRDQPPTPPKKTYKTRPPTYKKTYIPEPPKYEEEESRESSRPSKRPHPTPASSCADEGEYETCDC